MLRLSPFILLALAATSCTTTPLEDHSQNQAADNAQSALAESGDILAMPMPQPTEEHKGLQSHVGVWEGTLTSFTPGMPTTPMPAREVVRASGPFWIDTEFTCDFMGMPYQGLGSMGFDSMTGLYRGTWRDNMTSYLNVMEGERRADGTIVNRWQAPDMTGTMADHVSEQTHHGDDAYTMHFTMNGEPSMVIEMKRVSNLPR